MAAGLLLCMAGCTATRVDTAGLPPGAFGIGFNGEVELAKRAAYDWSSAGRLHESPAEPARAAGAIEYLAGAMNTEPRWSQVPATTQLQLLQARKAVRATLGIPPDVQSQAVLNRLDQAFRAMAAGQAGRAQRALSGPEFPLGGVETWRRLATLPALPQANVASQHAGQALFGPAGNSNGGQ